MEGSFRKIDVDAYDEDLVHPEDLVEPYHLSPPDAARQAKEREREVRGLLTRGELPSALALALTDAPYGTQYTEAKTTSLSTVLLILMQTKSTDVSNLVRALKGEEQDTLMKYLYKGMASAETQEGNVCAVLLAWHEKLTEAAGTGCIVRVMTDHRRF